MTTEAVVCTGLDYAFGSHRVVKQVDLAVASGEVFGLLGPNGAGKTTTIRAITTLLRVPAGMVRVFGLDVAGEKTRNSVAPAASAPSIAALTSACSCPR
ncbi:MAG TPA: ATP-binding cassette domain-containing protein [Kribbella sp.]|jgi:ABC-2 type transport system ATP-binding protein